MENKEKLENQDVPQEETVETEEKIDVVKGIETLESRLIESEKKLRNRQKEHYMFLRCSSELDFLLTGLFYHFGGTEGVLKSCFSCEIPLSKLAELPFVK